MGEVETRTELGQEELIQPSFNRSICIEARPTRVSGDTGALVLREVLELSGVLGWLDEHFRDLRTQDLITHPMSELLRTQILLMAQGWTDADAADWLRDDPILRLSVSDRRGQSPLREPQDETTPDGLASQPTLSRLIVQAARAENQEVMDEAVLRSASSRCQLLDRQLRYDELAVDMDALPMPVHGHQSGVEYNGYFHASGYYPLMIGSAQTGDFFGAVLRPGNAAAHGEEEAILERLDWIQSHLARRIILRFDAASVNDAFLTRLEDRADTSYVSRLKKNPRLERLVDRHVERYQRDLARHPEPLQEEGYRCHELRYQADSWECPRRVVLVLIPSEKDELPIEHHFFLITDRSTQTMGSRDVVAFYRQRGLFEAMLGELSSTLVPQLSSTNRPKQHYRGRVPRRRTPCRDAFAANQAILTFNLLAYNLLHLGRQAAEQAERRSGRGQKQGRSSPAMSLDTFRRRYLRLPSRLALHGRYVAVTIVQAMAAHWYRLWRFLATLHPVDMAIA